ncbi:hypothetical protein B0J11DRAFT_597456 [Dendryphion nanum]|uniref:Uncharacterized protein n=1 Tax=Dendryphion nanum TaxID=256645 RepID=A0A9P9EBA2_9PLEO|nr:hypothetical protein B0J11DRAFT_597456 [Dendryphion nanum]
MSKGRSCAHNVIQLDPSPFAEVAGYERPNARKRLASMTITGSVPPDSNNKAIERGAEEIAKDFPAPLVLPWDDLNHNPECPEQNFKSWAGMKERNRVGEGERRTIYVGEILGNRGNELDKDKIMEKKASDSEGTLKRPETDEIIEYLRAFYHGMEVKELDDDVQLSGLGSAKPTAKKTRETRGTGARQHLTLSYKRTTQRVRVRPSPDGKFATQLNLDDILDLAIAILPTDAYALVFLTHHDLYEDEDDDFCCGRAYGGSRVCVVQTARYNPMLDMSKEKKTKVKKEIEEHTWPLSHCASFVNALCAEEDVFPTSALTRASLSPSNSGIRAAIDAVAVGAKSCTILDSERLEAVWFSRVAKTVSHEVGHCWGMAHCVFFACVMQGTAGVEEDERQPPYLCCGCEGKVAWGVVGELGWEEVNNRVDGGEGKGKRKRGGLGNGEVTELRRELYLRERYEILRKYCEKWDGYGVGMWDGYAAWLGVRLGKLACGES